MSSLETPQNRKPSRKPSAVGGSVKGREKHNRAWAPWFCLEAESPAEDTASVCWLASCQMFPFKLPSPQYIIGGLSHTFLQRTSSVKTRHCSHTPAYRAAAQHQEMNTQTCQQFDSITASGFQTTSQVSFVFFLTDPAIHAEVEKFLSTYTRKICLRFFFPVAEWLNCVPSKFICWRSNPQLCRPFFAIRLLQM